MDMNTLSAFIAVARSRSFSQAALELHLTQPAVSKRVAALEDELSISLFHRVARQVSLTEAGQQLLPRALELLDQADDMKRYAANLSTDISGQLSVAIAHHIGLHRMPPVLKEFNRRYPRVTLDIHFEDSDQAFHKVEQGDIEFAVITLPHALPEKLHMELIWRDPLQLVIGPDHDLATPNSVSKNDLSQSDLLAHPCVLPEPSTETYQIVSSALQSQGQRLNVQMMSNNLESLKMLVSAGIGWSALPTTMVDESVRVLKVNLSLERQLGMVFHSKRSLSNAAQALVEIIREHGSA